MRTIGFSTGALALGDFRQGLQLLSATGAIAVELSALRDHELPDLLRALPDLDLSRYKYVSVHAPSRFSAITESRVADMLTALIPRGWPVVVHPDAIADVGCWKQFGNLLCIENMDKRKPTGRTLRELAPFFETVPEARLCFDIGHARQVDTTFTVGREILRVLGDRLLQVHLSELDGNCHHEPISMATVHAVREVAHWIKPVPVILESRVARDRIADELRVAALCFETARTAPSVEGPRARDASSPLPAR